MRHVAALGAAIVLIATTAAVAAAQTPGSAPPPAPVPRGLDAPPRMDVPPAGRRLTGLQAQAIADRVPKIAAERRKFPGSYSGVFLKGPGHWQVSYYDRGKPTKEIGQVIVDDATGAVLESYVGYKVAWTMARGYAGAFGRRVNSPWVWIPLSALFVAPFVTPRRPLRMLHLDLLALLAFGVSLAFFNDAQIGASVPLVYPLLAYLLARMLWIGLRRREAPALGREPLPLLVPTSWLLVAIVFLVGFRIGLNVTNSNVIDVGYAGVVGADRLADGVPLYGYFPGDIEHGDTYGPVTYEAYVPFEQALPWSGRWDDLPAAHAAAIVFDLLCAALMFLVGRMIRGPGLGIVLAYAWVTYPFTIFVSNTNSNDALVAVFALAAVLCASVAPLRGVFAALGGLTKFASLGLIPLLATHDVPERGLAPLRDIAKRVALFATAFVAVALLVLAPLFFESESLRTLYDRTVGYQAGRDAPFSIWGLYDIDLLQHAWQAVAVLIALGLAVVPRRRDAVGLAACAAAILIALQAGATYWFYLYIVWFFPLVMVALLGRHGAPTAARA